MQRFSSACNISGVGARETSLHRTFTRAAGAPAYIRCVAVSLYYFRSDPPNFGDELNTLLWQTLVPEMEDTAYAGVLLGIGTILDRDVPQDCEVFVLGSGAGNAPLPRHLHEPRVHVLSVRGPLTAALAGLPPELAVTDPALLLRVVYPQLLGLRERGVIFVPHFTTAKDPGWRRACARAGVEFVDPSEPCRVVLRKIASARLVIAEAMHAAIVADAFRVPWIPVASTSHFSTFKWVDWTLSLRVPFRPVVFPPVSTRHGCQRVWLKFFAERCRVDDLKTDGVADELDSPAVMALLDYTVRRLTSPRSRSVAWWKLKAAAFHRRMLDPTLARLSRNVLRPLDQYKEARVAKVLRELAASPGYRSVDDVCEARLQTLRERVESLRDQLASASARVWGGRRSAGCATRH